LRIEMKNNIEV